jgi:hypothetical protein
LGKSPNYLDSPGQQQYGYIGFTDARFFLVTEEDIALLVRDVALLGLLGDMEAYGSGVLWGNCNGDGGGWQMMTSRWCP